MQLPLMKFIVSCESRSVARAQPRSERRERSQAHQSPDSAELTGVWLVPLEIHVTNCVSVAHGIPF